MQNNTRICDLYILENAPTKKVVLLLGTNLNCSTAVIVEYEHATHTHKLVSLNNNKLSSTRCKKKGHFYTLMTLLRAQDKISVTVSNKGR